MANEKKNDKLPYQQRYIAAPTWITVICIVLLAAVLFGALYLFLLYQMDGRDALANAKAVRLALESTSKTQEALGLRFSDPSRQGGVAEGLYADIMSLADIPGDFQILQTGPGGYGLKRFAYTQEKVTVYFDADGVPAGEEEGPRMWTVKILFTLIEANP